MSRSPPPSRRVGTPPCLSAPVRTSELQEPLGDPTSARSVHLRAEITVQVLRIAAHLHRASTSTSTIMRVGTVERAERAERGHPRNIARRDRLHRHRPSGRGVDGRMPACFEHACPRHRCRGVLGTALVDRLSARGDRVRALVRRPARAGGACRRRGGDRGRRERPRSAPPCATATWCSTRGRPARAMDPRSSCGSTRARRGSRSTRASRRRPLSPASCSRGRSPPPDRRAGAPQDEPLEPVEPTARQGGGGRIAFSCHADRLPVTVARPPRIMGRAIARTSFPSVATPGGDRFLGPGRPLSWIDVDDCARGSSRSRSAARRGEASSSRRRPPTHRRDPARGGRCAVGERKPVGGAAPALRRARRRGGRRGRHPDHRPETSP